MSKAMKVSGIKIKRMVMESRFGTTVAPIKAIGKITKCTAMASLQNHTVVNPYTKVNTTKESEKA